MLAALADFLSAEMLPGLGPKIGELQDFSSVFSASARRTGMVF